MTNDLQSLNWRRLYLLFGTLVLIAPAAATPFTSEVDWGLEDFAFAAALMGGVWASVEVAVRLVRIRLVRLGCVIVVAIVTLALWAVLAVQF
jgi:hypothetical protein